MSVLGPLTEFWVHLRHLNPLLALFLPGPFQGDRGNLNTTANFRLSLPGGLGSGFGGDTDCGVPQDTQRWAENSRPTAKRAIEYWTFIKLLDFVLFSL